ncbi:MAG: mechanosensitive ion channel family protein [Kiritimatiellae bacterium]|nr:mechanosensitive ion channel family protein [Kiritimatiellia bacterium]
MTNETAVAATNIVAAVGDKFAEGFGRQVSEGRQALGASASWISQHGVEFLMNAVAAVLIFIVGYFAIKLISVAVDKALTRNGKRRTLFTAFVSSVVSKGCWAVLIIMVLGHVGVDVAPLIAGLGVTGFILGFAFQESLGNLASGLMIALNEPFRVGDWVEAAGLAGSVLEVNMMATVFATGDNKKIVVPNKSVWGGPITNYTALGRRRVDLTVGIAYGENIARAMQIAIDAVAAIPGILKDPEPTALPVSFDASSITLSIRPWAKSADYWKVYSAAFQAVKDAFDAAKVTIPFPQLDVHKV